MQRYENSNRKEILRIMQRAVERQALLGTSTAFAAAMPVVAVIAALGPSNPLHYLALIPVAVAMGLWLRAIPSRKVADLPFYHSLVHGDVVRVVHRDVRTGLLRSAAIIIETRNGQSHRILVARCDARRAVQLFGTMAPWAPVARSPLFAGSRHLPGNPPRSCIKMFRLASPPTA